MQKQTTIIHFVRHGEVADSTIRYGRLPGYHLSAEGRMSVEHASTFFLRRKITMMYASPLERTQQTATILGMALPHVPIKLDGRILEIKTAPEFEGQPRDRVFTYPHESSADAESAQAVCSRLMQFCEEKVLEHHGQEIIAVSHGDPIALLKNYILFKECVPTRRPYPRFASIVSIVFAGLDPKWVWYHGVDGHRNAA